MTAYSSVEVCAGAGGQALGLEKAGFDHAACVELDAAACQTLRANRPKWNIIEKDLRKWQPEPTLVGVDLLAGGVPCPPFSIAGQQLGRDDERDLLPEIIRLAEELRPRALMIENVRGLLSKKFDGYRDDIVRELKESLSERSTPVTRAMSSTRICSVSTPSGGTSARLVATSACFEHRTRTPKTCVSHGATCSCSFRQTYVGPPPDMMM